MEFLDHVIVLGLTFGGTVILFPKQLNPFPFPPAMYEHSIFSASLIVLTIISFLKTIAILVGMKVVLHCGFDLHFIND